MPTIDRRPRPRRRPENETRSEEWPDLLREMHAARADPRVWDALRFRVIRSVIASGQRPEQAQRMADAWRKKPIYLPGLPPCKVSMTYD